MDAADSTSAAVDSLATEIGELVVERQELRARGVARAELEANRRRLAHAHAQLSRRLIDLHLTGPQAA